MSEQRHAVVYRAAGRRTFKACRTCRLQKARCIVADSPPCKRCRATGRDCVFEEIGRGSGAGHGGRDRSRSGSGTSKQPARPDCMAQTAVASPPVETTWTTLSPRSLDQLHLDAPITAVHAMTSSCLPPSPFSDQSELSTQMQTPQIASDATAPPSHDVIAAGLVTESVARKLFQLYMANANVFLPLFDPATETFDVIRQRSALCLAIVLAVALRADASSSEAAAAGDRCFRAAQALAVQSLFSSAPCLESVQGMLLLAAYAKTNWFAVQHACQMGRELGLVDMLASERSFAAPARPLPLPGDAGLRRLQRTALVLHQVEEEIGSGRAQRRRGRTVDDAVLRRLLDSGVPSHHDMRIVSTVQIVQLRVRLLRELQGHVLTDDIHGRVQRVDEAIDAWFDHWDKQFQNQYFSVSSLYRSSLRLQRDYAFVIVCSAMLSSPPAAEASSTAAVDALVDAALRRSAGILAFIADANDYKWYLPWAPTYSALFPAFTAALVFRLARQPAQPSRAVDWGQLQSSFSAVADILQTYPYRHFSHLVRSLADLCDQQALAGKDETGRGEAGSSASRPYAQVDRTPFSTDLAADAGWSFAMHKEDQLAPPDSFGPGRGGSLGLSETSDYMLAFDYFAASVQTAYADADSGHVQ